MMFQRSKTMKNHLRMTAALALSFAGSALVPELKADDWDKQTRMTIDQSIDVQGTVLPAGSYVIGWEHIEDGLTVKFYEAASGKPLGTVEATLNPAVTRVESFRIWPPSEHSLMQIGRFTFQYRIGE